MKSLAYCVVKDAPRSDLSIGHRGKFLEIDLPELRDDEVLIEVRAAGLNANSIWSLQRKPADPFLLLSNMIRNNPDRAHHLQDFQVIGSDASGKVVEVGTGVMDWKRGDEVVVHCNVFNADDPITKTDELLSESQAIWGYETNYGAFATYSIVKANQLRQRPQHLSWEDSASYMLTLTTAYRMLVSPNGAMLKPGETCLIWGAAGGLGLFAIQLATLMGAIPIAVVSSEERAETCRNFGAEHFLFRNEMKHPMISSNGSPNPLAWREIRNSLGRQGIGAPDVVFEHVGRETLAASIFLARRGGRVVTCAASSGFESVIDLRYLWMQVKRIIGSHIANSLEATEANALVLAKKIQPTVSRIDTFSNLGNLLDDLHEGRVLGKAVTSISSDNL